MVLAEYVFGNERLMMVMLSMLIKMYIMAGLGHRM